MRALVELGTPVATAAAQMLEKNIQHPHIAASLLWALGQIGAASSINGIIGAIGSSSPIVRWYAVRALTAVQYRRTAIDVQQPLLAPYYLPELRYLALIDGALHADYGGHPQALILKRTLGHRHALSIDILYHLLVMHQPQDVVQKALAALHGDDGKARQNAVAALKDAMPQESSAALMEFFGGEKQPGLNAADALKELAVGHDHYLSVIAREVAKTNGQTVAPNPNPPGVGMPSLSIDTVYEFQSLAIFSQAAPEDLMEVARVAEGKMVKAGALIYREGDAADGMYIIQKGVVAMIKNNKIIDKLSDGEAFGVASVLDRLPREATAKAASALTLLHLKAGDVAELLADRPLLQHSVFRALTTALRGDLLGHLGKAPKTK